jgi:hypothetical protein
VQFFLIDFFLSSTAGLHVIWAAVWAAIFLWAQITYLHNRTVFHLIGL